MFMVPLSHYCCMNGDRQGKSYISLKRSDPYCVECIHRCVGELAGPGSNQNRVHVRRDPNYGSFRKRGEGRSWSKGRFEASSS